MDSDTALAQLATQAGILPTYRDLSGVENPTSKETKLTLLRACGWDVENSASAVEALKQVKSKKRERIFPEEMIMTAGRSYRLQSPKPGNWQITLEDSDTIFVEGRFTDTVEFPALPAGVHEFRFESETKSQSSRIICAPAKAPGLCDVAKTDRLWGVNLALYGLHSDRNPGLGDYADLAGTSKALADNGADFCGINPVHAMGWSSDEVISPYSPSHRGFLNTRHIAVDQIRPQSDDTRRLLSEWKSVRQPRTNRTVDYAQHDIYHRRILRNLFRDFQKSATIEQVADFETFCRAEGVNLVHFSRFECLCELHGTDWRKWNQDAQSAASEVSLDDEKSHAWLQWHAHTQLAVAQRASTASGMNLGLYLDLAVGSRRDGAEAWMERDSIAEGVSIGAPPDHLSPAGQNWNLSAFAPQKLASTGYRAFRQILSRNMRHCGVLRIDHILGLNRSFWIPDDGAPGGYIKQNFDALLALVRIEAARNNTIVIGEDLGLVPKGFRKRLQESGLYSYSVLQFEKTSGGAFRKPSRLRKNSLACFGTHDTPTVAGFAKGRDIDWWEKLGWINPKQSEIARAAREEECTKLSMLEKQKVDETAPPTGLTSLSQSVHTALAESPIAMISVQLDDIEQEVEAQNLPGTINDHPNWQRKYRTQVAQLKQHAILREIGELMEGNERGCCTLNCRENRKEN